MAARYLEAEPDWPFYYKGMEISQHFIPAIADDGSEYPIDKMEAHRGAVLHLAVSVFVFSGAELLIQRRADGKYHCAGLWANTCCSHPHWNEPVRDGAERRLGEELGLRLSLTPGAIFDYSTAVTDGLWENERVHTFFAEVDRQTITPNPDPNEVAQVDWRSLAEIGQDMTKNPTDYAPWFRIYMDRWAELGVGLTP
jgi:isopentenyl-diphosphate delta-isomerase